MPHGGRWIPRNFVVLAFIVSFKRTQRINGRFQFDQINCNTSLLTNRGRFDNFRRFSNAAGCSRVPKDLRQILQSNGECSHSAHPSPPAVDCTCGTATHAGPVLVLGEAAEDAYLRTSRPDEQFLTDGRASSMHVDVRPSAPLVAPHILAVMSSSLFSLPSFLLVPLWC